MRSYLGFLCSTLRRATSGIWGHVGNVALLVGFLLAIPAWCAPKWTHEHISERMNAFVLGMIPLLSGASVFLFRWLFLSPFSIYNDTKKELQTLRDNTADLGEDLYVTVLHFDQKEGKLSTHLLFHNHGSYERTVLSVNVLFQSPHQPRMFQVYGTGPAQSVFFMGHIDPLKIAPKGEGDKEYTYQVPNDRFQIIGAKAGLQIAFTNPKLGNDSATVFPVMEITESMHSGAPFYKSFFPVKNLSLGSRSETRRFDEELRKYQARIASYYTSQQQASQQPSGLRKYVRRVLRLFGY